MKDSVIPIPIHLPAKQTMYWATLARDVGNLERLARAWSFIGDERSTLRYQVHEAQLGQLNIDEEVENIFAEMERDLSSGYLVEREPAMYFERRILPDGGIRDSIVTGVALDYPGRTEDAIEKRWKARQKQIQGAPGEISHALLVAPDPQNLLLSKIASRKHELPIAYDFPLMFNMGRLTGYTIDQPWMIEHIYETLEKFGTAQYYHTQYGVEPTNPKATWVGDGNTGWTALENSGITTHTMARIVPSRFLQIDPIYRAVPIAAHELKQDMISFYGGMDLKGIPIELVQNGYREHVALPSTDHMPVEMVQTYIDHLESQGTDVGYPHIEAVADWQDYTVLYLPNLTEGDLMSHFAVQGRVQAPKAFSLRHKAVYGPFRKFT